MVIAFLFSPLAAEELFVAVSANAAPLVKQVATRFEAETGAEVKVSLAASGTLYAQIANGAPFDVFLSADEEYPRKLEQAGLTVQGTLKVYALGRLVLWTRSDSGIDVEREEIRALLNEKTQRVAIAVPERAPYGAAALQVLRRYAIYDRVRSKLVFGDSLGQAAQFVESGAAQVGLIGLSLALAPSMAQQGKYWLIPESAHQPIRQALVILKRGGRDRALAERFVAFFFSPAGQKALVEQGYGLPGQPTESRP